MQIEYEYECTISILVENQPSVLPRIVGLLTRRGFKVDSLAIGKTEQHKTSRIILILPGNKRVIDQITKQLYKLLPVIKIQNLTHLPCIKRELIILKILASENERSKLLKIATFFSAKILDFAEKVLTLEITGDSEKIFALEQLIHRFGILELVRTGTIALTRESMLNPKIFTEQDDFNNYKVLNSYISEIETKSYVR
jgi:acetolactate synthase-1/3 small subunit